MLRYVVQMHRCWHPTASDRPGIRLRHRTTMELNHFTQGREERHHLPPPPSTQSSIPSASTQVPVRGCVRRLLHRRRPPSAPHGPAGRPAPAPPPHASSTRAALSSAQRTERAVWGGGRCPACAAGNGGFEAGDSDCNDSAKKLFDASGGEFDASAPKLFSGCTPPAPSPNPRFKF